MEKKTRKKGDIVFYKGEAYFIEFCCSVYYGSDYKIKSCNGAYSCFVDERDITDSHFSAKYSVGDKVIYLNEINTITSVFPNNGRYDFIVARDRDGFKDSVHSWEVTLVEDVRHFAPNFKPGQRVFHAGEKFYISSMAGENYILVNKNWIYGKEVSPYLIVPVDLARDQIAEIEKALAELTKLITKLKQDHAEQESV